jgi:hypothetical protein
MCAGFFHGASTAGRAVQFATVIQPTPSTAAANIELAINRGVLLIDMLEIAGVLRWNVTRMRLPVADRRVAHQSRVLRQR